MHTISLEPVATLAGEDDARIVAFDVDYEGTPVVTVATGPLDYRTEGAGGATFAKTQSASKQGYRIYKAYQEEFCLTTSITGEAFNIHFAQPLPDGRLLLACGRAVYEHGTAEKNGRIYSIEGEFIQGITLGDGIERLQADSNGRIWASYFDEGVFGNFGWRHPLGQSGLVAWSADGAMLYEFKPRSDIPFIHDCYAMNVAKDGVWIYYYGDFPLVQIRDFEIAGHWQAPISGSRAFAVLGTRVLFSGGYNETNHYRLFALGEGGMTCLREFRLADASSEMLHADRVVGTGDSLYLLRGRELFHVSIRDVL